MEGQHQDCLSDGGVMVSSKLVPEETGGVERSWMGQHGPAL